MVGLIHMSKPCVKGGKERSQEGLAALEFDATHVHVANEYTALEIAHQMRG